MFHSVLIASKGRPTVLGDTLKSIEKQERYPDEIILCVTISDDLPDLSSFRNLKVLFSKPGHTIQRNAAIEALNEATDIVSIFDDDVELAYDYLKNVEQFFLNTPNVILFDGHHYHPGPCERKRALDLIASHPEREYSFKATGTAWGCNMNFRRWILDRERFDDALDSYAWLSDYDLSERIAKFGLVGQYNGCCFVHLQAQSGRTSDRKHGYGQLMNAYYYYRKGVIVHSLRDLVFGHLIKVIIINIFWSFYKIERNKRKERFIGNMIAIRDIISGYCDPLRVDLVA